MKTRIIFFLLGCVLCFNTPSFAQLYIPDKNWGEAAYCTLDGIPKSYNEIVRLANSKQVNLKGSMWTCSRQMIHVLGEKVRNGCWIVETIDEENRTALKPGEFEIEGKAPAYCNGKAAMLLNFCIDSPDEICTADTVLISDGKFYFRGNKSDYFLSIVTVGNFPETVLSTDIVLEEGKIEVNLDTISHIGGTPLNDTLQYFYDKQASTKEYIKRHSQNAIGRTFFLSFINSLSLDDINALLPLFDEGFGKNPLVTERIERLTQHEEQVKKWESLSDKAYTECMFTSLDGKKIPLSDFIGKSKLLFIDVWYSGCGPCIAEMPDLAKLYQQYKSKGLEVIAVSTDYNFDAWKNKAEQLNMPWTQLLADKENKFSQAYAVSSHPHGILIGEDGKIVIAGGYIRPSIPILETIIKDKLGNSDDSTVK